MSRLKTMSYINKLTFSSMLSTLIAVTVLVAAFLWYHITDSRDKMVDGTRDNAQVIALNSRSAIQFLDSDFLESTLDSLSSNSEVIEAVIFDAEGTALASFGEQGSIYSNPASYTKQNSIAMFSYADLLVSEPIFDDNELLGSVSIRKTMDQQKAKFRGALIFASAAFLVSGFMSYLTWLLTQQIWAKPFFRISRRIRDIAETRDYSKRLDTYSNDELGQLTDGFNALLQQIEDQNVHLIEDQQQLELLVQSRTQELKNANANLLDVISEKTKTEANLHKLTSAVTQAEEAVIITDKHGFIEYVNPSFEKVTGYTPEHAVGKKPSILRSDMHDDDYFQEMWDTLARGDVYRGVFLNSRPNGDTYHLEQSITPIANDNNDVTHYVATGRDITARIQNEKALEYLAHHDALTGLPNRSLLIDRIDQGLERCQRDEKKLAVMFIDLDGFKMTNDLFGHDAGDILLKNVASRLRTIVRSQDTVARISGDEFSIVLEDIHSQTDAGIVARKVLDALCDPYLIGDKEVLVTASVGVSVYPGDADDTRSLLKHADLAMYSAKNSGKARYAFYSSQTNERDSRILEMEHKLLRAVKHQEFELHYQPLIRTKDDQLYGVEALLRWQDKDGSMHLPNIFISKLEDSGMIEEVGVWVLNEACAQLAEWNRTGINDLIMSVNVSPRQLQTRDFVEHLRKALKETNIDPSHLQLEITERIFLAFNELNIQIMHEIAALGVKIAVDDFGMGHSSLVYLSKLPVTSLKIDRSFIKDITQKEDDEKIVSALIALAERMNLTVTAEGVETNEQLNLLEKLNCEISQGFLFARAMPKDRLDSWMRQTFKIAV